jgi:hypothetical protein
MDYGSWQASAVCCIFPESGQSGEMSWRDTALSITYKAQMSGLRVRRTSRHLDDLGQMQGAAIRTLRDLFAAAEAVRDN